MAKLTSVILLLALLAAYVAVVSFIASLRNVSLWTFWSGVVGGVAPWIVATLVVIVASTFVPQSLRQAAGMAALFPMLTTAVIAFLCPVISLLIRTDIGWASRMKWFAIVSSIPALLVTAFVLFVFVNDSRKT